MSIQQLMAIGIILFIVFWSYKVLEFKDRLVLSKFVKSAIYGIVAFKVIKDIIILYKPIYKIAPYSVVFIVLTVAITVSVTIALGKIESRIAQGDESRKQIRQHAKAFKAIVIFGAISIIVIVAAKDSHNHIMTAIVVKIAELKQSMWL